MGLRKNSAEHSIARMLREHEKRIEDLEEERDPNVEATLIRQVSVAVQIADTVSVTVDDSPVGVYDESKYNFSTYG